MKVPKELVVVEGKNDENKLKSIWPNIRSYSVNGSSISKRDLTYISKAINKIGVIVFTDPDGPGEKIRKTIQDNVSGDIKHCFIEKDKAKTTKKIGVEHATKEDIINSFKNIMTFIEDNNSLSIDDYRTLELEGSRSNRELLCNKLNISYCNSKQLFKRLNWLGIDIIEIRKYLNMV